MIETDTSVTHKRATKETASPLQVLEPEGLAFATECVHINHTSTSDNYNASAFPIYQTATFKQDNADTMGKLLYYLVPIQRGI